MRVDELPASFAWGSQDDPTWQRHVKNLVATGQMAKPVDPVPLYTNEFSGQYNDFDHARDQLK